MRRFSSLANFATLLILSTCVVRAAELPRLLPELTQAVGCKA